MELDQNYKIYLDKDIQNWIIHENNYFMHGDHLVLMKTQKNKGMYLQLDQ